MASGISKRFISANMADDDTPGEDPKECSAEIPPETPPPSPPRDDAPRPELEEDSEADPQSPSELLLEGSMRINGLCSEILSSILSTRGCFWRISSRIDGGESEGSFNAEPSEQGEINLEVLLSGASQLREQGLEVEAKFSRYEEKTRKEKRDLEDRILGLTEENADISRLLRIALVEKEAAEKSLNRLKGSGEQRRTAILQIAEWGLQKAGFGFLREGQPRSLQMSTRPAAMPAWRQMSVNASAVEKIVKNLRHEVTELRCSLGEQRSENEHLQSLTDKQVKELADRDLHIKILEERENMLARNVEELSLELKGSEDELARWREACKLEVEYGNIAIRECQSEIAVLKEDFERTKAALDASNNRLKLKEKLAEAAIAAHAAAETSLRLADSRSVGLREVIEELTRQLEEEAERNRRAQSSVRRRVRHICWPWRALRVNPSVAAFIVRGNAV
ncbi:unnamed protein product [Spirodela intermedia]|uniref:Uncharacterized protein n=1 Tax=Spirodela intermedia TaxID=51605 RepID=A0A7I8ID39_SPIIN|nr:unnamed protein product [Spirodela intermedia]CAA6655579.1 unnamed protein product [Spirodela intermedia]